MSGKFTFLGMNNVSDPAKLAEGYAPMLLNVDADDTGGTYERPLDPYTGEGALPLACFYHGRNYSVSEGNTVIFDKGLGTGIREYGGKLEEFDSNVTMLAAMADGLYIGTENEVVFVGGGDPMTGDMSLTQVHRFGVTAGTCCQVDNVDAGIDAPGYSICFLSHNGICIGANSGQVKNVTVNIVAIPKCMAGSATMRTIRNMTHYVVKLHGQTGQADKFVPIIPSE